MDPVFFNTAHITLARSLGVQAINYTRAATFKRVTHAGLPAENFDEYFRFSAYPHRVSMWVFDHTDTNASTRVDARIVAVAVSSFAADPAAANFNYYTAALVQVQTIVEDHSYPLIGDWLIATTATEHMHLHTMLEDVDYHRTVTFNFDQRSGFLYRALEI